MVALERVDPPRRLGAMTLLARLGEGAMATVYLAGVGSGPLAHLSALKLLRAGVGDDEFRTRFIDEARLVVRLHHNNIVAVRNAGEVEGQLYIAMDAIDGRDLDDVRMRCAELGREFPLPLAVHVCREILRGLHYAHGFPGLSLVHRDVAGANILIDWAGAVRLTDFGLATSTIKASLTSPGIVLGRPTTMSPEQARGEPLDARSDVYSLTVVLWELLTGRSLRTADMTPEAIARFAAPSARDVTRRVDVELDRIVAKGLARDLGSRWASAEAMMLALAEWLSAHAPEAGQEQLAACLRGLFGDVVDTETNLRTELLNGVTDSRPDGAIPEPRPVSQAGSADDDELIPSETVIAERYRVLTFLGRGGMGFVYLGEHVTVGRSVAIKVLTQEWSRNHAVAQRFRAEARAASAAGHANIIEVFDAGELADGRLYLVMEFLTGRNLYEEVQDVGPLAIPRACHIMRDVARAIRAAHQVGIIHRDLKPDNVMLIDRGHNEGELVKVLDFGISASAERNEDAARLTVVGEAIGTPEYMAPEQALGRAASESFDIYALGVIFFELLTGAPPFVGSNVLEVLTRKTVEAAPSVASLRPQVPAELAELIDDCLATDPSARPATAQVFLTRLEEILRGLPRPGSQPGPQKRESPTRIDAVAVAEPPALSAPSQRGGWIAAAAITVGLVIVGGIAISNWQEPADPAAIASRPDTDPEVESDGPQPETDPSTTGTTTEPREIEHGSTTTGETSETGDPTSEATETGSDDPRPAPHKSEECGEIRSQAAAADRALNAEDVIRLTRANKSCWARKADRTALEVSALFELGRYAECAKLGKAHSNANTKKTAETCQKRVDQG